MKLMSFNISHGADYELLCQTNTSPYGPICFGFSETEKLAKEPGWDRRVEEWYQSVNLEKVARVIASEDCDIIALNELRSQGPSPYYADQAKILGELTGRNYCFGKAVEFFGEGGYGLGILSRYPIIETKRIEIPPLLGENREPRIILQAVVKANREITVLNSHFGGHPQEQQNAVNTLLKVICDCTTPVIFMGDLNTTPHSGILDPLYQVMNEAFFKEASDTFPSFCPQRKIDYIFASKSATFSHSKVVTQVVSDHFPLVTHVSF